MSWHAPQVEAKRCFIGPSGHSLAVYCAEAGAVSAPIRNAPNAMSEKPSFAAIVIPPAFVAARVAFERRESIRTAGGQILKGEGRQADASTAALSIRPISIRPS